jgi:hypothetical protein
MIVMSARLKARAAHPVAATTAILLHRFERVAMRQREGPAFISAALGRVERTPKTALRFAASPEAATIASPWLINC